MSSEQSYVIAGGRPLRGAITVSGSKNAALYAIAAGLLTADTLTLRNVPRIADIDEMAELLRGLGSHVEIDGETVRIATPEITCTAPPADQVLRLRASFLCMGPLLARAGVGECVPPGGDVIGSRPLDVHFVGFRMLGAEVTRHGANWRIEAARLHGARIFFDYPSVLGTVNVLFAAVLAQGHSTIINAAPEPEVAMAARLLNAMGARITGEGTPTIEVDGVTSLHGADFAIIPDRLEAGTYLLAGAATGGDVRVTNAVPNHMDSLIAKLRDMGMTVEANEEIGIRAASNGPLEAVQVQAVPYPGFATDLHPQMAAAMTQARGLSLVHERVYDNRTLYVNELRKLGARIVTGGDSVIIEGPTQLTGSVVRALDIRAGASVVVAGLAAEGETTVLGIGHLDRGYADLEEKLQALGAEITRR
ncbi:MAG: UDP-N-acetylglucosamine 1-carboxyvinyltransferase [Chloroflexota bacterium]